MTQFTARLSVVDQAVPVLHTSLLFCFPSHHPQKTVKKLERGLAATVRQLPYLAGHVARGDDKGFTTITWSDEDTVEFEQLRASSDADLPSYPDLVARRMPLHELEHDFRPTGALSREYVEEPGVAHPAMLAAYTLLDGGLVVCWSIHHHVAGGEAMGALLHRWALNTGGLPQSHDAELDAFAPLRRYGEVISALDLEEAETAARASSSTVSPASALIRDDGEAGPATPLSKAVQRKVSMRLFAIRVRALDALRDELKTRLGEGASRPSSVATLAALIWCIITETREKRKTSVENSASSSAGKTTTLMLPVPANELLDQRTSIKSRNWIGNLLSAAFVTQPVTSLAPDTSLSSAGFSAQPPAPASYPPALPSVLQRVTRAIPEAMDFGSLQKWYRHILTLPDVRSISSGSLGPNDLIVTSWAALPFLPDFGPGIGKPEFVRTGTDAALGGDTSRSFFSYTVILPRQYGGDEEDVIELFMCFEAGDMAAFEQNSLWKGLQY